VVTTGPHRTALPPAAAWLALGGFLLAILGAAAASIAAALVTDELVVVLLAGQGVLWAILVGTVFRASRRYGSGSLTRDFPVALQGRDLLSGFGWSLVMRLAGGLGALAVALALGEAVDVPDQLEPFDDDRTALVAALVLAVVGAPFVEELFFRGLVMRSLRPRFGTVGALVLQALLFAVAHASVTASISQNLLLLAALGAAGLVLGFVAHRSRRLGPAIAAHAWFNLTTAVIVIAMG
jgi:uncharacterized protein